MSHLYRTLIFSVIAAASLLPLSVLALYAVAPGWKFPDLIPAKFDLRAVHFLASQAGPVTQHMLSSLAYSLLAVLLSFGLCIAPAHHFARRHFKGKALMEGLFLAPALVPSMAFSMGVHFLFIKAGLADTFIGIVMVLTIFSYPYMLRALTAGYQAFGEEFELCAKNLGAGPIQRFLQVDLPMLMPAAIAGGSVVFLVAFSEYFLVFLIGGGAVDSFTGYLFPYLNSSDRSLGSLLTLVFLTVPVGLFVIIELVVSRMYRRKGIY
ncbi:ABC transporter permease subunit [Pseudodesulfovibrio sp. zrk46]|uniref:ABC transporter permease n=1 Tax=Pseudodesulfovibrio sp. zrk46 TaxID=2725288 RepID=UPI001449089A|nr:ABC transporter permease subunit [Pseudodesulfovibrio sp. zrk46]QJB56730.1 ABC transporter permease subunit [Pseudodesulfovibrio sp. zrk46]